MEDDWWSQTDRADRDSGIHTYVQTEQKGVQVYDRPSRQGFRYMTERAERDSNIFDRTSRQEFRYMTDRADRDSGT